MSGVAPSYIRALWGSFGILKGASGASLNPGSQVWYRRRAAAILSIQLAGGPGAAAAAGRPGVAVIQPLEGQSASKPSQEMCEMLYF